MALVTTKKMFEKAYAGGYAIGAFNINNMEIVQAIADACKKQNSAVILQVSKSAFNYMRPEYLKALVDAAVAETGLDICLHLDHGADFDICKKCIEVGFTSLCSMAPIWIMRKMWQKPKKLLTMPMPEALW